MTKSFNFYCVTALLATYLYLNADYQRVNALLPLIRGAKEYNLLPEDIWKINNISSFKRKATAPAPFAPLTNFIILNLFIIVYYRRTAPYRGVVIKCMYVCNSLSETCRVSCTSPKEEGLYQNCGREVLYHVFNGCFWRVIPRAWPAAFCNVKLNFTPQTPTPFPSNFLQKALFPHTNCIFPKRYSILHQNPSHFINYPKTLPFTAELLLLILM